MKWSYLSVAGFLQMHCSILIPLSKYPDTASRSTTHSLTVPQQSIPEVVLTLDRYYSLPTDTSFP